MKLDYQLAVYKETLFFYWQGNKYKKRDDSFSLACDSKQRLKSVYHHHKILKTFHSCHPRESIRFKQ
jgi:replication fork clamp-binding protein CrfC